MTGLVRKATLFVVSSVLLGAGAAMAGTPYPANSSIQWFNGTSFVTANRINLVDYDNLAADPNNALDSIPRFAKVWVTVKDISGNAINAADVELKFQWGAGDVTSDTKICATQQYHGETVTTGGGQTFVKNYTNTSGIVTFVVGGASTWAAGSPIPAGPPAHPGGSTAVQVWSGTTLLFSIGCGTFDYTRLSGVDITDLSRWAKDLFAPSPATQDRSDFNGVTVGTPVEITDASIFATALFNPAASGRHSSCAALVP